MRQRLRERAHGAAILRAVNDEDRDLLKARGDGLPDAAMSGIDDIAVAAIRFRGGGWTMPIALIVASSRVGLGLDFERRALSGFSFSARGSTKFSSIAQAPWGFGPPLRLASFVFFPKTPSGPQGGWDGATADEHPCPAGASGARSA
jgi:hypothetical protein